MSESLKEDENESYEIHNSIWKNMALFVICLGMSFAGLLALLWTSHGSWAAGATIFFGACASLFGFKTFDRRTKIYADSRGIQDFRTDYGVITWSEIDSLSTMTVKGNFYLTLYFRNPDKWLPLSSHWVQWLVRQAKMKFGASISLQNTDVDERQFIRFIDARIAGSSSTDRVPKAFESSVTSQ